MIEPKSGRDGEKRQEERKEEGEEKGDFDCGNVVFKENVPDLRKCTLKYLVKGLDVASLLSFESILSRKKKCIYMYMYTYIHIHIYTYFICVYIYIYAHAHRKRERVKQMGQNVNNR